MRIGACLVRLANVAYALPLTEFASASANMTAMPSGGVTMVAPLIGIAPVPDSSSSMLLLAGALSMGGVARRGFGMVL